MKPKNRKKPTPKIKKSQAADVSLHHYHKGVFQQRNVWMVDRSSRVIAFYNGATGGTKNTIDYAAKKGIEVIQFIPKEEKQ